MSHGVEIDTREMLEKLMETQTKALRILQIEKSKAAEYRLFKYVFAGVTVLFVLLTAINVHAQQHDKIIFNNVNNDGVILDGYDPVAFFSDNKPVKGDPKFQFTYDKAIYYFASQENLDAFKADPEKYKPQFGGWCAFAVSLGRVAPIDLNTFSIVNNRLVIQHNQRAMNGRNKDVQGSLALAISIGQMWLKKAASKLLLMRRKHS